MKYEFLRFPGGKTKAVTFSYDDNNIHNIRLAQKFTEYGLKCTFNLHTERENTPLKEADVKEYIANKGHEIAVHTYNHRALGAIRPIEGIKEVLNCRIELEHRYGGIIRGMAYADTGIVRFHGETDYPTIKQYLTELGIAYARTLSGDNDKFLLPTDWHAWMPSARHENPNLMNYIDKFNSIDVNNAYNSERYPRLLYIWGHSYEFEENNNWDLLDKMCEKVANNDDVWYATNIEICDYVNAFRSLVYSADCHHVYNPTLFEIWFDIDRKLYKINPGETLNI